MYQVQEVEPFIPASEEDEIEVQCLLVEPENDHALGDGVLCFHKEALETCMTVEDFPGNFDGGSDYNAIGGSEDRVQLKVLDGMPGEGEGGHFTANNVSTCEDYLIDIGFSVSVSDFDHDSHLWNSGSESKISGFSGGDNVSVVISDSSTAILVPECQNDLLEKTICELHRNGNSKCEFDTSVQAKWLKFPTSEPHNVDKLDDVFNILVSGCSSDKIDKEIVSLSGVTSSGMSSYPAMIVQNNEGRAVGQEVDRESFDVQDVLTESSALDNNACANFTQKRLRKPTLRYIDESSNLNSRYSWKRREISTSTSADKFLGVRHLKYRHMRSRKPILSSDESFTKAIQVPFGSQRQKEWKKKNKFIVVQDTDMEISPDRSKRDSATTVISEDDGGHRKHHKLWTLSEVRTLIDGVSHYGVGRWTQIKRLLFSSSAHRTPVDLKDKWRNLLKASCSEEQRKKEDEKRRNHPWRPLPKYVLRRVSELASIYPYPRYGKSKLSNA